MSVLIDGREYDSYTYVVWVDGLDLTEAKHGESGEQFAARILSDDPEAWELLSGQTAVDGDWRVEPLYDDTDYPNCWAASSALKHYQCGPKLADGQFESEHARELTRQYLDAFREAQPARTGARKAARTGGAPAVRTVELPAEDVS